MRLIVDRFENEWAMVELEDGRLAGMPKICLPDDVTEGSIVEIRTICEETEKRRSEMRAKMASLFREE